MSDQDGDFPLTVNLAEHIGKAECTDLGRSYAGAAGGKLLLLGVVSTHHQLETLMEVRTVNNLAPAAPHDDAVRCLLAIELS